MSDIGLIGLADLIQQIKRDLQSDALDQNSDSPLFGVSSVELELQVTMKNEGKSGIKFYVVDFGGTASRDDVQKIKVSLSPLLTKEQLLAAYREQHPEKWKKFVGDSANRLLKGSSD